MPECGWGGEQCLTGRLALANQLIQRLGRGGWSETCPKQTEVQFIIKSHNLPANPSAWYNIFPEIMRTHLVCSGPLKLISCSLFGWIVTRDITSTPFTWKWTFYLLWQFVHLWEISCLICIICSCVTFSGLYFGLKTIFIPPFWKWYFFPLSRYVAFDPSWLFCLNSSLFGYYFTILLPFSHFISMVSQTEQKSTNLWISVPCALT
jgi:hypothetical protein